ncbi:hypothetical protein ACLMJK_008755 [Lecanora helva]
MPSHPHDQYSTILPAYDAMRTRSASHLETANVRLALTPLLQGNDATVLDLACGSGFYSHLLPTWGAKKAVGVDISETMVGKARERSGEKGGDGDGVVEFRVADCSIPVVQEGGPFDVVFAAWLLNYAPSKKELANMFLNVHLNLKPGGKFLAVVPPGYENPAAFYEDEPAARPGGSGGMFRTFVRDVEDGVLAHAFCATEKGDVVFDYYHLRKSVYGVAAREAGFGGEVGWRGNGVPGGWLEGHRGEASREELESYNVLPQSDLLSVTK